MLMEAMSRGFSVYIDTGWEQGVEAMCTGFVHTDAC